MYKRQQYSYSVDKCLFMPAEFTGGLEYNFDELKDEMLGYNRIVDVYKRQA